MVRETHCGGQFQQGIVVSAPAIRRPMESWTAMPIIGLMGAPRVGAQYEPDSVWSVIFPLVPGNGNLQAETTAPKRPLKSN